MRVWSPSCASVSRGDGHRDWTGLRLVHVGSALEYGRATGPIDEGALAEPTTDYGRSKLAGTRHVVHAGTSRGLRAVVARLFSVYGPGEHHHRLLPLLQRAARTRETLGLTLGDQRRDFTYVEDVAEGLLRLGLAGSDAEPEGGGKNRVVPGEIVHVATGRLTSVREFAETAAGILGLKPSALAFGVLPTRPDELRHGPVSVARLETITSWLPRTSIADGIRRSVEHSVV